MPVPDGHSLVKIESKKSQKELISIILWTLGHRWKWWSGKHSSHCMLFVLWRTAFIVFCNAAAVMQITIIPSLVTCYLFFRCGIEKESLSWAFPQHSPTQTHTFTHRLLQTQLSQIPTHTLSFDIWVEYIPGDVVYPSCLTWFQSGGGTGLSFFCTLHVSKDKAWKPCSESSTHSIIQALMEWSGHACVRPLC